MKNNITIGIDLGDKFHIAVVFDGEDNELETARVTNTKAGVSKFFQPYKSARVAWLWRPALILRGSAACWMRWD